MHFPIPSPQLLRTLGDMRTWESPRGGFSQTGSQNSHTCIPGRLPSGSLWPRGDTTQWARKLSVRARPVLPLPHHLATGKLPGLCFLSYKMKNRTNPTSINAN